MSGHISLTSPERLQSLQIQKTSAKKLVTANLITRRTVSKVPASQKRTPEDKRYHTYPHQNTYKSKEDSGIKTTLGTQVTATGVPCYGCFCGKYESVVLNKPLDIYTSASLMESSPNTS